MVGGAAGVSAGAIPGRSPAPRVIDVRETTARPINDGCHVFRAVAVPSAVLCLGLVRRVSRTSWHGAPSTLPTTLSAILCALGASAALFCYMMMWRRRGSPSLRSLTPTRGNWHLYLQALALIVAVQQLLPEMLNWAPGVSRLLAARVTKTTSLLAPALAIAWVSVRGIGWRDLCADLGLLPGAGLGRELLVGLIGGGITWCVTALVYVVGGQVAAITTSPSLVTLSDDDLHRLVLVTLLWAPVAEELTFRGLLLRGIGPRPSVLVSLAVSALGFSIMHRRAGMWPEMFVAGLGFGTLRHMRESLVSPIVAHAVYNGIQVLLLLAV